MGNWRSVWLKGTCGKEDVEALAEACEVKDGLGGFHCLSATEGLGGLGDWPEEDIDAVGNLAERDYSVESVRRKLVDLVKVAPSLDLFVHCGGEHEDKTCVATVLAKDGEVKVLEPGVESIPEMTQADHAARVRFALGNQGRVPPPVRAVGKPDKPTNEEVLKVAERLKAIEEAVRGIPAELVVRMKKELSQDLSRENTLGSMMDPFRHDSRRMSLEQALKRLEAVELFRSALEDHEAALEQRRQDLAHEKAVRGMFE